MNKKAIPENPKIEGTIEESDIIAAKLVVVCDKLALQMIETEKREEQLITANKELASSNKQLAFQNVEKEKRAAELIIANNELAYQNREKEHRAAELIIANKELVYQNQEKGKSRTRISNSK